MPAYLRYGQHMNVICFQESYAVRVTMSFKDWAVYVREHKLQHKCRVYLSLGGKEEKTKNKVMATVGERTREQERILRADPSGKAGDSGMECGRSFADSGKRLAKGIRWLLMNNDERR